MESLVVKLLFYVSISTKNTSPDNLIEQCFAQICIFLSASAMRRNFSPKLTCSAMRCANSNQRPDGAACEQRPGRRRSQGADGTGSGFVRLMAAPGIWEDAPAPWDKNGDGFGGT